MEIKQEKVKIVVMACVSSHNFLQRNIEASALYSLPGSYDVENTDIGEIIPGSWRNDNNLTQLGNLQDSREEPT